MSNINLPDELLIDILSRLPVKSLLRFMCVSKTWLSLISSDSNFAVLQYKQSAKNSPPKILISTSSLLQSLDCSAATTTSFGGDGALRELDFPYKIQHSIVHVIGSCNGLVCLALGEYKQFVIWNPTTRAYRRLPILDIPDLDIPPYRKRRFIQYSYGFGYDSSTNDYKVFFAYRTKDYRINDTQVFIFATKEFSWRSIQLNTSIQCCDTSYRQRPRGLLLSGSLHWLTRWDCDCQRRPIGIFTAITAFDLAEEKLFQVPIPHIADCFDELGVIDGCLCAILRRQDNGLDLWIKKEYEVEYSWEVLHNFGNCKEFLYHGRMVPLCSTKWGESMFINNGNELIRCNLNQRRRLEHLMITSKEEAEADHYEEESTEAIAYVESLLLPHMSICD